MVIKVKGFANINFGRERKGEDSGLMDYKPSFKETLNAVYGQNMVAVSMTLPLQLYHRIIESKPAEQLNRSEYMAYLLHQGVTRLIEKEVAAEKEGEAGDSNP